MAILTAQEQIQTGDYANLGNGDEYAKYFNLSSNVLHKLLLWFEARGSDSELISSFQPMVDKLLYTTNLLRHRYLFDDEHNLALDLNDSGFPHAASIHMASANLEQRDKYLRDLPSSSNLLDQLVKDLLNGRLREKEILKQLGLVRYFEGLDQEKMYLLFTPGNLRRLADTEDNNRCYVLTWAVYSIDNNMPYFHSLAFQQDSHEFPLEDDMDKYKAFLKSVELFSGHSPSLGVIAHKIDEQWDSIHPAVAQRVQIGPIHSPIIGSRGRGKAFVDLLSEFGSESDFVLELMFETVYSCGTQVVGRWLGKRKRQVFLIPQDDLEAKERGVSQVNRIMMIPHTVLQHIDWTLPDLLPFKDVDRVTYSKGGINDS
ncbi:MAG: hypothetical protein MRY49_02660 [Candidatus Pacebacteria bacterium]|nr:hypothetical protein [Candidatus Paceibacterota bacterium]